MVLVTEIITNLVPSSPNLSSSSSWESVDQLAQLQVVLRWSEDLSSQKLLKIKFLSILSPHRVLTLHVNKTVIDKDTQHKILKYFAIYMMIILSLIFIVSLDSNDF